MVLVLLAFGPRIENHQQAVFSIVSFLSDSSNISSVYVVTDEPNFYNYLQDRIKIVQVNSKKLKEWQGDYNFFWRIKIKALQHISELEPGADILYVDSDTFLAESLDEVASEMARGRTFMHQLEGAFSGNRSRTVKRMRKALIGKTLCNINFTNSTEMWNAGVIAIPGNVVSKTIQLALELCDAMCAIEKCPRKLVEQLSFSVALKETGDLASCEKHIIHYWGNKNDWNKVLTRFFTLSYFSGSDINNDIKLIKKINLSKIPFILLERTATYRLRKLLRLIIKPKKIEYYTK